MNIAKPINVIISIVNYNCQEDILETIQSYKHCLPNHFLQIIVIDNFYDEKARKEIKRLSVIYNFFLIESENFGYGHANNLAFKYAKNNFEFDFFIVSNPDIQVISIDNIFSYLNTNTIIAPKIKTLNGILQNPFLSKRSKIIFWLWKIRYSYSSLIFRIIAMISTKFVNFIARLNKKTRIYSAHGALIILTVEAANRLETLFDSKIFLFGEEFVLAEKAYTANIPVVYDSTIRFLHKCHISTGNIESKHQYKLQQKSFLLFFNDYLKK